MKISELRKYLEEIENERGDIDATINGAEISGIVIEKNMFGYYADLQSLSDDLSGSYMGKVGYY